MTTLALRGCFKINQVRALLEKLIQVIWLGKHVHHSNQRGDFNRSLQARRESLLPRTARIDLDVEEVP